MINFWQQVFNFCTQLTEQVGAKLLNNFAKLEPSLKNDGSLVTKADKWADAEIRKAITAYFPTHGVLTEETEHILPDKEWCWVIDPIDGTTNFTRGIPIWGISIGLLYEGTPVFGFVHFPQINQTYHGYYYGDTGLTGPKGSYLNKSPIYTSNGQPNHNYIFNICARSTEILAKPFPCKIRMVGVASYNILLVACGAALGGVEATPKIWDIAGAYPILQGAGGQFIYLGSESVFPLIKGQNYGNVGFPCLSVARAELAAQFKPFVSFLIKKKSSYNILMNQ